MKLNKAFTPWTLAVAAGVAVFASLPLPARAATWTNQAGGYWLDTNNWLNFALPSGGGASGAADFTGDWVTTGELVITTDLTPVSTTTGIPRFRNILYNDTGAASDAALKLTGTNALNFYNSASAADYPWIGLSGASVVRVDVGIQIHPDNPHNTIRINCTDNTSKVTSVWLSVVEKS